MSLELNNIKKRIKSVTGAYKVTSAMKLVSTVKLKKYKNRMLDNKIYIDELDEITRLVLSSAAKTKTPFNQINDKATKDLYIIISSTLGLCGSYNMNIFKVAEKDIKKEDDAIILGKKALLYFKNGEFNHVDDFNEYNNINDTKIIDGLTKYVSDSYIKGLYKEVHLIYTEYKNSLVFIAKDYQLLPLVNKESNNNDILLEPNPQLLVDKLIPMFINGEIYSKLLESEVSEQASRCNAMDNATENAKEILDSLQIEFNKARQASITQEITEIVGAANAL